MKPAREYAVKKRLVPFPLTEVRKTSWLNARGDNTYPASKNIKNTNMSTIVAVPSVVPSKAIKNSELN